MSKWLGKQNTDKHEREGNIFRLPLHARRNLQHGGGVYWWVDGVCDITQRGGAVFGGCEVDLGFSVVEILLLLKIWVAQVYGGCALGVHTSLLTCGLY